jgi:hypothetical protein
MISEETLSDAVERSVLSLSSGWRPLRTVLTSLLPADIARCLTHPMSSLSP